ncbi:hypothetical protein NQ318_021259, partial [Aromia moschata]
MASDIIEFYREKTVLVTGGTGFLGKMLTEKLLRTCAVDRVYLIVRPKKGLSPEERVQSLFEEPVFEKLKEKNPSCIKKVLAIEVSTAYSNCYEKYIEEKFYETPIDPELLIKITEELKPNILNSVSSGLIGIWPNPYVFSKAVAENLLLTKGNHLPVALFRPTIVTSAASEPLPGWSDNLYGPLGILLSSHCGILRVVRANGNIKSHTVPGDMCINAMLCFAWDTNNKKSAPSAEENFLPPVLNFSGRNSKLLIPMKQYVDFSRIEFPPFKRAMWHQILFLVEGEYAYRMAKFVLHTIPAYLIDSLLVVSYKKTKRLYAKLDKTSDVLRYFLLNEWDIDNENVLNLWQKLNDNDKAAFNFDINTIDVNTYFKNLIIGLKKYILKEDMTKAKFHRQRYK